MNRDQNGVKVSQAKTLGKCDPGRGEEVQRPLGNIEEQQERHNSWNGVSEVESEKR